MSYRVPAYKCVLIRERSILADRKINASHVAIELAVKELADSPCEQLIAFSVDTQHKVIGQHTVTVGVLDSSLVQPREVFRSAIILNAAAVIVAHNHPSGELVPSGADWAVFDRLRSAGTVLGITLLDSIIVNDVGGVSMLELERSGQR